MTQYSIERQQTLQAIQKRHEELLRQNDGSSEFAEKEVRPFLEEIAQAGKSIENPQERSWLRDFIGYWSGIVNEQAEELPIVQLQPFDLSQVPRRSNLNFFRNPIWFVAILALIIIILVTGFISFRSFILHPSPTPTPRPTQPSAFHCPTSQQVSAWMNVDVSQVTSESCAFTAGNNGKQLSGVVCTSQDGGTTIEFIPVNQRNTVVVRACDGSRLPDIWGLTIRFISGYPSGDASVCAVARSARNNVQAGWKVQADC